MFDLLFQQKVLCINLRFQNHFACLIYNPSKCCKLEIYAVCTLNLPCPASPSNIKEAGGTPVSRCSVSVTGLSLLLNYDSNDDDAPLYEIYCRMENGGGTCQRWQRDGKDEDLYENMFSSKEEHREKRLKYVLGPTKFFNYVVSLIFFFNFLVPNKFYIFYFSP